MALGIFTLALGAAIGASLPASDIENRTLGPQRDLLTDLARDVASDQIDQLKAAAGEIGEKVMSSAKQADVSAGKSERSSS